MQLTPRHTPNARVEEISRDSGHYRLSIPSGSSDSYRLAQLDDYAKLPRKKFPHHSLNLSLSARTSSDSIPGTWGFGVWNNPFGMSLGFGGESPLRLPALPNAAWFFGASRESYLSFRNTGRDNKNTGRGDLAPTSGFMAQTFRSPRFHPLLMLAGLAFPFSRRMARRLLGKVIEEDGINLGRGDPSGPAENLHSAWRVAPTNWHRYRLEWSLKRVSFEVDDFQMFESAVSPNPPLGVVIWIDNQYAAFTPAGKIGFGVLENAEPAWLEVKDVELS